MANFPTSLDTTSTLPNPTGTSTQASPDHAALHTTSNVAVIALETKLGTGSSTPSSTNLLVSTGTGTSAWSKLAPTGTIVGTSDSQVLTNKTLTSPTINGGTLDNVTVTVDSIAGHTTSNTGTIYGGISVTAGNVSLSGTLAVTGATTLSAATTVSSTLSTTGQLSLQTATAPPAAGATTSGIKVSSTSNFGIFWGSGAPTFSAAQGALYMRTDGSSTSTRLYINTTGSTTWTNVTTAA